MQWKVFNIREYNASFVAKLSAQMTNNAKYQTESDFSFEVPSEQAWEVSYFSKQATTIPWESIPVWRGFVDL